LDFDPNDPDEAYFVHTATRYYQAFDLQDGSLVVESRDTELLGIRPTSEEVATLARNSRPSDVETSGGIIRFHNSVFQSGPYRFLIRVGISMEPVAAALDQYLRVLLFLIPASVLLAGFADGRWQSPEAGTRTGRAARRDRHREVSTNVSRSGAPPTSWIKWRKRSTIRWLDWKRP
jgi:hypothetical protein